MPGYVVFRGHNPGVYQDWSLCNMQVAGYKNCLFKRYANETEAIHAYNSFLSHVYAHLDSELKPKRIIRDVALVNWKYYVIGFQCVVILGPLWFILM